MPHVALPTRSIVAIWVKNVHTELMVEIYYKSLVRAIGKVELQSEFELERQLKPIKVMKNRLSF